MSNGFDWVEQPIAQRLSSRNTGSQDAEATIGHRAGIGHSHCHRFEFPGWNLEKVRVDSKGEKSRNGRR